MLKKLIATLAIVSLSLTPISLANAAVKAGSTCPKAGNTAIASGKTFTCIKSGKKLVWDKGVLVPSTTNQKLTKYEQTKFKAYEALRAAADTGKSENLILKYFISESFPTDLKNLYVSQVEYASKFYSSFFTTKTTINIYLYTEKDSAKIQADSLLNNEYQNLDRWFKQWEKGLDRQHNLGLAASYIQRDGVWQGFAGLVVYSGSTTKTLRPYAIQVMPHEYWHVVQDLFIQKARGTLFSDSDSYDKRFPPTFREGSANTVSFALANNSFKEYLALYKNFIDEKKNQQDIKIFQSLKSEKDVVKALNQIELREGNPDGFEASYSLGQLMYEWFIAEYGIDGFKKLLQNQLTGASFDDNLKLSVGISKDQLYSKAAGHILSAFTNFLPPEIVAKASG
jgi:hypothetical protein